MIWSMVAGSLIGFGVGLCLAAYVAGRIVKAYADASRDSAN